MGLTDAFAGQAQALEKALRRAMEDYGTKDDADEGSAAERLEGLIAEEEREVQRATFMLRLLKLWERLEGGKPFPF